jgi:hypothetical protein
MRPAGRVRVLMRPHEHEWIDITTFGQAFERRMCVMCNEEHRRFMPALAMADGLLADADWEMAQEGVGQSL